ncbi:hypothetical protein SCHPADRAFT_896452, partial [Schizopora paradoxa]
AEGLTLPAEFGKHEEKLVEEDNQVDLLEHIQKDNISRYAKIAYTAFRVGDVVEVTFSVIAVPCTAGMRCMKLVLRALCLENTEFTTDMTVKKATRVSDGKKRKREVKEDVNKVNFTRARCYVDVYDVEEEVETTDKQMSEMDLEEKTT